MPHLRHGKMMKIKVEVVVLVLRSAMHFEEGADGYNKVEGQWAPLHGLKISGRLRHRLEGAGRRSWENDNNKS